MLRFIKEKRLSYTAMLIYSNKDKRSSAFLEELNEMQKENSNFRLIATMTQDQAWPGVKGRVDAQFIKNHISDLSRPFYFVCGPPALVTGMVEVLISVGIPMDRIKTESFTGY